jgi:hypothetical protein
MTLREASVDFSTPCRFPKSEKAATAAGRPFIDKSAKDQAVAQLRMTAMRWTASRLFPSPAKPGLRDYGITVTLRLDYRDYRDT